jgi:hypothetical protein
VKYVVLIHSSPEPWGHPSSPRTAAGRAFADRFAAQGDTAELRPIG